MLHVAQKEQLTAFARYAATRLRFRPPHSSVGAACCASQEHLNNLESVFFRNVRSVKVLRVEDAITSMTCRSLLVNLHTPDSTLS